MAAGRSPTAAEIRTTILVAAPLAAANLAQMAMQVTNALMVGHLGAVSFAAAGIGNDCVTRVNGRFNADTRKATASRRSGGKRGSAWRGTRSRYTPFA